MVFWTLEHRKCILEILSNETKKMLPMLNENLVYTNQIINQK